MVAASEAWIAKKEKIKGKSGQSESEGSFFNRESTKYLVNWKNQIMDIRKLGNTGQALNK